MPFPFCSRGRDSAKRESSTGIWAKLGILSFSASFVCIGTPSKTAAQTKEISIKPTEILTANIDLSENGATPATLPVGLSVASPENFPVSLPVEGGKVEGSSIELAQSQEGNTVKSELPEIKQTTNLPGTNLPATGTNSPATATATNSSTENRSDTPLRAIGLNPDLEDAYFRELENQNNLGVGGGKAEGIASPRENRAQRINESNEGNEDNEINESLMQLNSVSELSDVQPSDWAFQALQSLIERYDCLLGYRDGTYRGNQALNRYEFAANLDACMENIVAIASSLDAAESFNPSDLNSLQRLQEDFAAELASLEQDINRLETRKAFLETVQFSATTKLFGQVIFGIQGVSENEADFFPVDDIKDARDPSSEVNIISNMQLSLLTQLSSRSLVLAGVQMGNGSTAPRLTNDRRLGYEGDTDNTVVLSDLNYRQLVGNRFAIIVGPAGVNMANVFRGINRIESAGRGPISALGQRNPIINIGSGRGGFGFDWQISSRTSLQGVYAASTPTDAVNGGIFGGDDGDTSLGMQLTLTPIDTIDISLNYVNAYSPFGLLGTGVGDDQLTSNSPLKTNAFGATLAWRISPQFVLGTWGGYTNSYIPGRSGNVETTNWMVFVNVEDLFASGDLVGIYVGQPPKIVDSDLPLGKNIPDLLAGGPGEDGGQPGTTTHLELFYKFAVSEDISLTPGFLAIFEPGQTPASDTIFVGVVRTTFSF
ncbi:MAG: carbohydrate porin [Oscillatoria sp. SIO1A7]|nr:carbohydrate porin [Oscillatoria sp. SIO1A7]